MSTAYKVCHVLLESSVVNMIRGYLPDLVDGILRGVTVDSDERIDVDLLVIICYVVSKLWNLISAHVWHLEFEVAGRNSLG